MLTPHIVLDPRTLLRQTGLQAKKSFGQNFLVAESVATRIANTCVEQDEAGRAIVVEIGAGLGSLTSMLLPRAATVIAIERDRELVPVLTEAFAEPIAAGNLRIIEDDALALDYATLFSDAPAGFARVLAGNLPYQLTGRLLRQAVISAASIDRAVFMVQNEVAARLVAKPSTKAYGALTVFVQAAFDVKLVQTVSRGCFHPMPNVVSAVVRLVPCSPARAEETDTFRALVKGAFAARRKTLRNAWGGIGLTVAELEPLAVASGLSLDARGETLHVEQYAAMADAIDRRSRAK